MKREQLVEIKRGQTGTGLLIESDGFIDINSKENKLIKESIEEFQSGVAHELPRPFVVSAVFQKYGIENANGRIYPEAVLKREVEKYQQAIKERRAYGECYRPSAMILTETGWKQLSEVNVGENILTLNPETKEIEIKPIKNIIKHGHDGDLIHIEGRSINELVTPGHSFPTFDRNGNFKSFITAEELHNGNVDRHSYIPKTGKWIGKEDKYFVIPKITEFHNNISKELKEKYSQDLIIPMDIFAKFMGIYLSEGSCDKKGSKYRVNIHQKKQDICEEIEKMLDEWGIDYSINVRKDGVTKTFVISDIRLNLYLRQFGLCYDKFIPFELKQQNSEILRIFYDWFVMGDGRIRGDKRICKKEQLTTDVFSTSKRLALDLNEIILKIGYSSTFHEEKRDNDRVIEGRLIESKNTHPMYFAYKSLTKGIYTDKRFLKTSKEYYNGDVMCVEVDNHIWYVMENGKAHWTKNCNHPSESAIDAERLCMNIIELHWVGRTLVGKMELPITEGFRRYGICSNLADTVAQWIISGLRIGVSSRGLGSVTQQMGKLIVGDDYEIVCWDVVTQPSTPNAWIETEEEKLQPYLESKENNDKPLVKESNDKYSKFDAWLND